MTEKEWINLGKQRIVNILRKYIACTQQQLEMKISEAGPYNQRVEPVLLKDSRKELLNEGIIVSDQCSSSNANQETFYYLNGTDGRKVKPRIKKIYSIYCEYEKISKTQELCGNVLEYIVHKAVKLSDQYTYFATIYEDTLSGIKKFIPYKSYKVYQVDHCNDKYIKRPNATLDMLLIHKRTGIPIGVEIKNKRPWKYGEDREIWLTIEKCVDLEVLPLFVHRKIPVLTKFFFKSVGMLGMETQFQYFHPSQRDKMRDIIDKNLLGYSDIKFDIEPPEYMVKYFKETLPRNLEIYYNKFLTKKDILNYYARDKQLASDNCRGYHRNHIFAEAKNALGED